ncbi:hypothetical protein [Listeria rustica]|uniref:Uncharacterized protein n=1 Tax=Listeria rustica TaxID=2713503 RepID=A0A7W1T504_9LIST|nr:hypothetical protein [Listeria rustica]MBA3925529.1 hypothetical protein [Listeria rustica]
MFDKKMLQKVEKDIEARKARAKFYREKDESIFILETQLQFFKYGLQNAMPSEWKERYEEEEE